MIKVGGDAGDSAFPSSGSDATFREEDAEQNHSRKNSWKKPPFVVNNMEHRHNAQQKILEQQQKQIQEQQKLIEELTYLQKQQLMQQQITTEALLQQQVGNDSNATPKDLEIISKSVQNKITTAAKNVPKMANHLDKLQRDLIAEGELVTARLVIRKLLWCIHTENETDTETDNKCIELNGNLCCYLSRCSVKCSAYYSGTHNYHSLSHYRSRSRCRSV